jgi:hypothetical protein
VQLNYAAQFVILILMGCNHVPVSVAKLQHGSQICLFCNIYLIKNNKIARNSTTTKAREKISTDLESPEFFEVCLTNLETIKFYFIKLATDFY